MKKFIITLQFLIVTICNQHLVAEEIGSEFGAIEFERSCSSCHGFDGKGNGFLAQDLKIAPADLTQITKNNSGHFPFSDVYRAIDGSKRVGMHGSREMPVWGEEYRKEAEEHGLVKGVYTRGVILELMLHIYSIQEE